MMNKINCTLLFVFLVLISVCLAENKQTHKINTSILSSSKINNNNSNNKNDESNKIKLGGSSAAASSSQGGDVNQIPQTIKISLTNNPNEMMISWFTIDKIGDAIVQFSVSKSDLVHYSTNTNNGVITVNGKSTAFSTWKGYSNSVVLTGLSPKTTYYYQCGGSTSDILSQINHFTTSNFPTTTNGSGKNVKSSNNNNNNSDQYTVTPFTVAVYADMGYGGGYNNTVKVLEDNLSKYSLILHIGDIAYADYDKVEQGNQTIWTDFLQSLESITSKVPYMTTPGNHDVFYSFTAYQNTFNMPGSSNMPWYSYDYNGVHFLSYSTESDLAPFTQQYQWIKNDLETYRKKNPSGWVIAYAHRPYYCSTQMDWCRKQTLRALIESTIGELFQNYNVDIYLAGHTHAYERTVPVYQQSPIGSYDYPGGTVHFTIGTPGNQEGLDHNWILPAPSWSASRYGELGYGQLNVVNNTHILWQFLTDQQVVFDEQWIVKGEWHIIINKFKNYCRKGVLKKPRIAIPTKFIKATEEFSYCENNLNDTSKKTQCFCNTFDMDDFILNIFGCPRLNDTRGEQEEANIQLILKTIDDIGEISAIIIVINGSTSRLSVNLGNFLVKIKENLLGSALLSICFILTNRQRMFSIDLNLIKDSTWRRLQDDWDDCMDVIKNLNLY
ncbi:hypothetical protein RB653_007462 [Dictyostelium firmibasis]|uniref:Purple acid phosphatase n=1 Tax=Dictyostelium firmibasis TaxID=79012 RepID=A0AAN7YRC2_9MYCE